MPDAQTWIDALQSSHDHCVRLVEPLTDAEVKQAAYAEELSIAVTASPLGSLVDRLPGTGGFAGRVVEGVDPVSIQTTGRVGRLKTANACCDPPRDPRLPPQDG